MHFVITSNQPIGAMVTVMSRSDLV